MTTKCDYTNLAEKHQHMGKNALKLLDAGVTTARDLGCPGLLATNLRDEIAARQRMGPRCVDSAGSAIFVSDVLFLTLPASGSWRQMVGLSNAELSLVQP